mmetsp:Transcript_63720/g.201525  ORF Transcript_63720/g.201525 Transcript_63720/m.201525 type:complete len:339 (-) Transcript_63720:25-1041(-)
MDRRVMSMLALVALVVVAFQARAVLAHDHDILKGRTCMHHEAGEPVLRRHLAERNKVPEEAHRAVNRPNRLLQSYEPAPIRFHVDWQATGLPADVQAFLRDDFIPEALGYLSRHMKVKRPVEGDNLKIPRTCAQFNAAGCVQVYPLSPCFTATRTAELYGDYSIEQFGRGTVTIEGGAGTGVAADFVLFVTADDDGEGKSACEAKAVAVGGTCDMDSREGALFRPISGFINLCPSTVQSLEQIAANSGFIRDTFIHEVIHALAVSTTLYSYFRDPSNPDAPLGYDNVISEGTFLGQPFRQISTPNVVAAAREHFGCSTLEGLPLEDDGGTGTVLNPKP